MTATGTAKTSVPSYDGSIRAFGHDGQYDPHAQAQAVAAADEGQTVKLLGLSQELVADLADESDFPPEHVGEGWTGIRFGEGWVIC